MRKGLLLLNLGSPESPEPKDVKVYLQQFLTDRFVIDIAAPLRYFLVHAIITPFRSKTSAEAYKKIWTEKGSPLIQTTREFAALVQEELGSEMDVRWGMRYGHPSVLESTRNWNVDEILIVPLYPQYAESSTRSAIEDALKALKRNGIHAKTRVIRDFYGEPEFIEAELKQIQSSLANFTPDVVLLSFHGLPEHHLTKLHKNHCEGGGRCCETVTAKNRFCYRAQCTFTANALRSRLNLGTAKVKLSFQSRLGRRPWIKPYTDILVSELAASGVKKILVACPSFVSDCLETLEEVGIRLREQFLSEGGEDLRLVPAPNTEKHWIEGFVRMIKRQNLNHFESSNALSNL